MIACKEIDIFLLGIKNHLKICLSKQLYQAPVHIGKCCQKVNIEDADFLWSPSMNFFRASLYDFLVCRWQ